MHDAATKTTTVDALEELILYAQAQGYVFQMCLRDRFDEFPRIRIGTVKIIGIDCFAVKRFIIQFIENIVMRCV